MPRRDDFVPEPCSIEGCPRPVWARGWCSTHYRRWYKKGDPGGPELLKQGTDGPCTVDGCDNPIRPSGWGGRCVSCIHGTKRRNYPIPRRTDVRMSPMDIGWLAGIIEGEGSFDVPAKPNATTAARIVVTMTDKDIIDRLYEITGTGTIQHIDMSKLDPKFKPQFRWCVSARADVVRVLLAILPLLGERRHRRAGDVAAYVHAKHQLARERAAARRPTLQGALQ